MLFRKRPPLQQTDRDLALRQVAAVSKTKRFPTMRQWAHAGLVLTRREKSVLAGAWTAVVLAVLFLGGWYFFAHHADVPAVGGSYTEALVGEPQFVNPLYASSNDPDADIARLVYSGLMRRQADGTLVDDLASDVHVSADGKTYTITMRADARFQNGDPVQAKDVVFTYSALQDPLYRSPLAGTYQGVDISQTDDRTVVFSLKDPDAFFPSFLTVGILPSNLWSDVAPRNTPLAAYNLKPIGSGPYRFKEFEKDRNGNIRSYTLERNAGYYGAKPLIDTLTFKFYDDAQSALKAVETRSAEGVAYVPPELEAEAQKTKALQLLRPEIPQQTILFFNQDRQTAFKDKAVRQAIALALDRRAIMQNAVGGQAEPIVGPVLDEALDGLAPPAIPAPDPIAANKLLDDAGYAKPDGSDVRLQKPAPGSKKGAKPSTDRALSFTLTTVQTPEFLQAAQTIATELSAIGIKVQISAVDAQDLAKTTLETRSFDLLLVSLFYSDNPDPYPFWHSSQATMKGLNLADYAVKGADDLLVKARGESDPAARAQDYEAFDTQVMNDVPAVFLYRPTYAYGLGADVKGASLERIRVPSDRFSDVADWYVKTRWKLK